MDPDFKACAQCKILFTSQRSTKRFCSDACKHARARNSPPLVSADLGNLLDLINSGFYDIFTPSGERALEAKLKQYVQLHQALATR